MKRGQFSKRKAVIVAFSICLVFGIASWLARTSPYDFEVVSVVQNPGENMRVKLKFTNGSDEPIELWTIENGIQSVGYIPASETVPKFKPLRTFGFSGVIRSGKVTVPPQESLIVEDFDSIRKSGDEFIAVWQPPPSSDWISTIRRKLSDKIFGSYPIDFAMPPPKTMKERLRHFISPDPPRLLVSEKFVVP